MSVIKGEITYKWLPESFDEDYCDSEYDKNKHQDIFLAKDFSLEESAQRSDDLFVQMYIGYIDHPCSPDKGYMFINVGINSQGGVEWVSEIKTEGRFIIISENIEVSGPDTADEDYDDFIDN